jgi:glycosyltransferase involved in cell wall biosynthesis
MLGGVPASWDSLGERVRIAVVVPCLDEQGAIADVVRDFSSALPGATVYVYDNGSEDSTVSAAERAGAVVRHEPRRGKGNVVRRMFADIEADIYVMVDGDGTYDASAAPQMVSTLIEDNLDMVIGRRSDHVGPTFRRGHALGNRLFAWLHRVFFGSEFEDVFSGYRVMSRRLVKSFPTTASGFEIEAELTVHALDVRAPSREISTVYGARGGDSASKLRTYRDGLRILIRSILFYKELHPGRFFSILFAIFAFAGLLAGIPVIQQYADTGEVLRIPLAVLAASLEVVAFVCLVAGVILDSIARRHRELKRLHYLQHHAPAELITPATTFGTGAGGESVEDEADEPQAEDLRRIAQVTAVERTR